MQSPETLPGVWGTGGASGAGPSVSPVLPGGRRGDSLPLVEHEVQAVADQFDYGEEHGH